MNKIFADMSKNASGVPVLQSTFSCFLESDILKQFIAAAKSEKSEFSLAHVKTLQAVEDIETGYAVIIAKTDYHPPYGVTKFGYDSKTKAFGKETESSSVAAQFVKATESKEYAEEELKRARDFPNKYKQELKEIFYEDRGIPFTQSEIDECFENEVKDFESTLKKADSFIQENKKRIRVSFVDLGKL